MKFDKYISTTLPYANSVPHVGHALEFIQADAIVKEWKRRGLSVFFNVGVDEHGLKVYQKAKELGVDTQEYLDCLAKEWIKFCTLFDIDADNFYRTTSKQHADAVVGFWYDLLGQDLYKKTYTGRYCKGCEAFKADGDLIDGKCPDHDIVPEEVSEENWFFSLTTHKEAVLKWLDENHLYPNNKIQELRNIIESAEDVSVSRLTSSVPWGINVPENLGDAQVIYVWFEALLNYIFAVPDFDKQDFVQICGPDNIRFQGCLFQAMLHAGGYNQTSQLLVHGTVLDKDGRKMSKTVGNVIDPIDQYNKYGLDAVRLYVLAGLSTSQNCCWSESDLVNLYNSELADSYGNLIARTLHLIDTKDVSISIDNVDRELITTIAMEHIVFEYKWDEYDIQSALQGVFALVKYANKYLNDERPWSSTDESHVTKVLNNVFYILSVVTELYSSVLDTNTYIRIKRALENKKKVIIFNKLQYENV